MRVIRICRLVNSSRLFPVHGMQGRRQAFRAEYDRHARMAPALRHRPIVAQPRHSSASSTSRILKRAPPDGRASSPAKIFAGDAPAEWPPRRSRPTPSRWQSRRRPFAARNDPAVAGGGADAGVLQRRDQLPQPAAREAHVGIGENQHFNILGQRFDGLPQVEHLFAAILRRARRSRCAPGAGSTVFTRSIAFSAGSRLEASEK